MKGCGQERGGVCHPSLLHSFHTLDALKDGDGLVKTGLLKQEMPRTMSLRCEDENLLWQWQAWPVVRLAVTLRDEVVSRSCFGVVTHRPPSG